MSTIRQPSEWGIGKVKTLFSYLEYKVLNEDYIYVMLPRCFAEEPSNPQHASWNALLGCLTSDKYTFLPVRKPGMT